MVGDSLDDLLVAGGLRMCFARYGFGFAGMLGSRSPGAAHTIVRPKNRSSLWRS